MDNTFVDASKSAKAMNFNDCHSLVAQKLKGIHLYSIILVSGTYRGLLCI